MNIYSRDETKRFLAERVARPASAGVIIENAAGEALLLKANYKKYWSFPGGWIEHGQTPLEAALRELQEETNIVLSADDLVFAFVVNRSSELMQTYQFMFKAETLFTNDQDISLQASEIDEWKFVSKDDVLADKDAFGGAVVAWAEASGIGYYEQVIANI